MEKEKSIFLERVCEINNFIDRNPQKIEPNMREIMACYVDLATISATLIPPLVKNNSFNYVDEVYNQVINHDEIFKSCCRRMREIIIKRKLSSSKEFTELSFFDKEETINILDLFEKMVKMGCYPVPVSSSVREAKKKLICDTVAIAYEIWNNKEKDSTYQYSDRESYLELTDLYLTYRNTLDMSECNRVGIIYDRDGCEVIDTDKSEELLRDCIDNFMEYIDENYKDKKDILKIQK